jgi:hypothetical protein
LSFASVAFLPEGEVEIVAVVADPVAFSGLSVAFDGFSEAVSHFLDRSIIGFHLTF